jgi:Arc/MetJ-type ribon-helix-helix transcriptional regulator
MSCALEDATKAGLGVLLVEGRDVLAGGTAETIRTWKSSHACGMAIGMATKKVTVTLEEDQLIAIRALVESGSTSSVSAFVQHAVAVSLNDVAGWGALLASALDQTGGPLTRAERTWADEVLLKPPGKGTRKRTKAGAA